MVSNQYKPRKSFRKDLENATPGISPKVINAFIINTPSLESVSRLRNIMTFFIESLSDITTLSGDRTHLIENVKQCEKNISAIYDSQEFSEYDQYIAIVKELYCEISLVGTLLDSYYNSSEPISIKDKLQLDAKLYKLRYLLFSLNDISSRQYNAIR